MSSNADVYSRDFLHRHAETPLCEHYIAAGALCSLSTNSISILNAARATFGRVEDPGYADRLGFSLRLWVDENDSAQPPWPNPYVRGLDHLVYAGFDSKSSFLADLSARHAIGRFSAAMAADARHWRTTIFPILMSIIAGSVGLVELHSSCIAKGTTGLLILGPGHSGKSTLAMAMRDAGFRVLSDDRTFCSIEAGRVFAYGLPRPIKLRRDAGLWFEEFRDQEPRNRQNGEAVYYAEIGPQMQEPCEPKAIVYLEREGHGCRISRIRRSELKSRLQAELLAETPEVVHRQQFVIESLMEVPCWHVQYGAAPQVMAQQLARLLPNTNRNGDQV